MYRAATCAVAIAWDTPSPLIETRKIERSKVKGNIAFANSPTKYMHLVAWLDEEGAALDKAAILLHGLEEVQCCGPVIDRGPQVGYCSSCIYRQSDL
mmetsp:Transcript_39682/g.71905  ORF Transcript_39682/g.71905 Transcript_39682/m.71905 type:complete len:97 (+) Transcript_39682:107-397(+)